MDNARQQIVDSIKANSNILVTVSTDPSVDELSAALGLTILLNNIDKRTSAVFSGSIPPAINFLEPDKTFESSADSLRDFIIALDKEKADHLRYKVDGDVVKIFITPYRTTLTQADLEFSQGDYNVELVVAIGVKDQDHLDKALAAHGKILHDATVVTITSGNDASSLGSIDWHDPAASSLSEMMVSLTDGLKTDKPLLDQQIASAFLTGIVSATDRFSNDRTSSRVMTMAAQLMAAGANQQLIAAKLEEAHDIAPGRTASTASKETEKASETKSDEPSNELTIDRSDRNSSSDAEKPEESTEVNEEQNQLELEQQLADLTTPPTGTMADIEKELQEAAGTPAPAPEPEQAGEASVETPQEDTMPPLTAVSDSTMPGFEPAPAPEPLVPPMPDLTPIAEPTPPPEPKIKSELPTPTIPIVNEHGSFTSEPPTDTHPINSIQNGPNEGEPTVDPFTMPPLVPTEPVEEKSPQVVVAPEQPLDTPVIVMPDVAAGAVGTPEGAAALGAGTTPEPAPTTAPAFPSLPPLPPLPADGSLPPLPPPPPPPATFGQPVGPMPSGAISADQLGDIFGDSATTTPVAPAPVAPTEPGQFKIPGSS